MDKFWEFLGQLAMILAFSLLVGLTHWLRPVFVVFYAIGMAMLSISADLMEDADGTTRKIMFLVSSAVLLIPALAQNILLFTTKTGTLIEMGFFVTCATGVLCCWYQIGVSDMSYWAHLATPIQPYATVAIICAIVCSMCGGDIIGNIPHSKVAPIMGGLSFGVVAIEGIILLITRAINGSAFEE